MSDRQDSTGASGYRIDLERLHDKICAGDEEAQRPDAVSAVALQAIAERLERLVKAVERLANDVHHDMNQTGPLR